MIMLTKEERDSFKEDSRIKLIEGNKEWQRYKSTGKIIYLQQAGEKLFSAVENLLQIKYNAKANSYGHLRKIVKSQKDSILLVEASRLHYFYYNGELREYKEDIELVFQSVLKQVKKL
jgi:hypothetical protein